MNFQTTIQPSGHQFSIADNETILEAALKNGYTLPYSCRDGVCGVCKGKVLQGEVDHGHGSALTEAEKNAGMALFCCAKPQSDLIIECQEVNAVRDIQVKTMPCRVHSMEKPAEDVMVLKLKLPANERLQFLAGQYIDILLKDQKPRSFSLANAPHTDEFLELHIRNIAGGAFTHHVFEEMKARDILRFKGPLGTFFLREDSDKPIIFVASGTGFAPIKAIIEHALYIGIKRPMHFYWGARKLSDLYMLEMAKQWEAQGIQFTPVLSDALPEDHWQGRTGFVHRAVLEDYSDLSAHVVYACGAPVVVEAAHTDFTTTRGLPNDAFFSDAFTFTPKTPIVAS
ncbi:MAG TPA: CDP-6-deoxy-delta-3,4-glucoseen reductase [Gallionella sp.]|jgi:CDP-4-dehydro-6-deoxyglucose reductase|nr:MAG: CDP-6-deoxy-delta-3,4-glucoseen reductase [Gallionellales bacterium GWA2_54_124]OGT17825.1 MAG: CDP-6-deoxy-delta-3,4-glucoseen reductase [Gallionellales bacterium RIFOXYD12_FULL_53_10]HCI53886.1 CDP-6-deoxy-delta-3,4-glucoseen reductase [Gallionella sp.]